MVPEFSVHRSILRIGARREGSYRGLMRCVIVKRVPRTMQIPPTATYAIPRKGFLPPITVRVDMTIDFVPPYTSTGKSRHVSMRSERTQEKKIKHTVGDVYLVHATLHGLVIVPFRKLAEIGKSSGSHPDLESFICFQVWWRVVIAVSILIPQMPVGRNGNRRVIIFCLTI